MELLVVITIVVVLAALIFAVGVRARDTAQNAQCVSSLRRLAIAGQSYAATHGSYPNQGRQPDGGSAFWFKAMEEELGFEPGTNAAVIERAETMPTCKKCLNTHGPGTNPNNRFIRTYSMNHGLLNPTQNSEGQFTFPGLRAIRVKYPSRTAFFMDGTLAQDGPYWHYLARRGEWLNPKNFIHGDKANVVFIDGHVEAFRLGEVPTDGDNPFWNPLAD
ncbi:hypothetical protein MLD59_00690 [Verrucomicrobiaceae bacterium E54]|nr:hypothetical protein [Verrucomicrobiaceae bacterium E54]